MKKVMFVMAIGASLMLAACGSNSSSEDTSNMPEGEKLVKKNCISCHGGQLEGRGNTPALNNLGSRMTEDEILDVILNGTGKGMPPGVLKGEEAEKAAAWLAEQK